MIKITKFKDIETECLVYGQIGITKAAMGDYETALSSLSKCKDMSGRINNLRLNLDSLICISNIKFRMKKSTDKDDAKGIFQEALTYADELDDQKYSLNCVASLGILEGERDFTGFLTRIVSSELNSFRKANYDVHCLRSKNKVIKEEIGFQEE